MQHRSRKSDITADLVCRAHNPNELYAPPLAEVFAITEGLYGAPGILSRIV